MPVNMSFNPPEEIKVTVAVVGGGVSGIYSAWRLARSGNPQEQKDPPWLGKDVAVFEYGNRVGGRLESIKKLNRNPEASGRVPGAEEKLVDRSAEVGGMRFLPSWQKHVTNLIKRLGLESVSFPMGNEKNLFFLRGRLLRGQSFMDGNVPYELRKAERDHTVDELFEYVLNTLLASVGKKLDGLTRKDWDDIKKNPAFSFDGKPLYQQGFWNVLAKIVSAEAYKMLTEAGGYSTLTANWNAAEAASFIGLDFINAEYKTLKDGYDAQVAAMANEFTKAGGKIWGYSELVKFDKTPDGKLRLTMRNRVPGFVGDRTFTVIAEHLILAMPRHGLERLELHGTRFDFADPANAEQRKLRDAVMKMPAFKLFMLFEKPWWEPKGLTSGRSVCDLPIRQTYYFGTESGPGYGLLMTSYNDAETVSFWKGLQWTAGQSDGTAPPPPTYISENTVAAGRTEGDTYDATPEMIKHAVAQLSELHNMSVPDPIASCYKDWSAEPFGAGWYLWKPGEAPWKVMPRIRRPWTEENVYVCGDCYSTLQGWVEGALNTAEKVLQDHFRLEAPDWLSDVYLGY
ncbi:flavin monoamine oxidase family protein [Sorangium sp. So ce1000]|uniref:flavin monoamine oxidase family protein n=1 Tax=Sorangium sp. So ce1000 TaxID=3133325 RepID=UPI003F633700